MSTRALGSRTLLDHDARALPLAVPSVWATTRDSHGIMTQLTLLRTSSDDIQRRKQKSGLTGVFLFFLGKQMSDLSHHHSGAGVNALLFFSPNPADVSKPSPVPFVVAKLDAPDYTSGEGIPG